MVNSIAEKSPYLADVIRFFIKPELYLPAKKSSFKDFLLLGFANFILIVPVLLFVDFFTGDRFDSMVFDDLEDNPYLMLFAVAILAPILEEVLFRYHQNRKYFSIIFTLTVAALVSIEVHSFILYVTYLFVLLGFKISKKAIPIPLMVYFTSGFFALVHLTNYIGVDWWIDFYWAPLLVFSQFIGGIVLSFIRLHEGLFKAMLFHAMWNGFFSLVLFLPD
ncbi:CPBP family glutamic-type intramembrane protease [Algoriphagus sp.]|uniref:CPBP family glutamic-type intramembrane protease n=1 Tax=Algoriphagus sp. TaxID=1872435 RepID=UPI003F6E6414